ncbi:alpha/beta fold hydrolase [Hymenobacter gummosus]|uniref:Alpha/beta fold hydrolase n=1 Tax=Hymenobacter gummosus TaxID=1776032 RepID=A0A3S0QLF8_9BACT|nr:alpha/beta fold hydrolase [Hymenobacter gummosus]RTQ53690.1 alpha/beta fold hydrolase [Hymenobacter gummosus]
MLFDKLSVRLKRFTWLFSTILLVAPGLGCQKEGAAPVETPEAPTESSSTTRLLGSTLIGEYTPQQLATHVSGIPFAAALIRYPIRVYKLTYSTKNTDGQTVTASGALIVPTVPAGQALPLLSYQHGTISPTDERKAPSYYSSGSEIYSAVSVLASTGYVVSAPDYIGYGAAKALPHPYEHAASLASTSLDMLRAAKEFCQQEQKALNAKTFLLGYSEGGYATLALHRLIETDVSSGFTVTASAPGAGAYHKSAFASYIMNSTQPLNFLSSYVWVLDTYNRVYGLNRPASYYYNEPYATQLTANPLSPVPTSAAALFTPALRTAVLSGTDSQLTKTFRANDIYDWKPVAPLALFHGTADDYVPFFNSQDAYDAMRARGASQVQLRPIQGGNHFTSATQYTLEAYAFISQYY